MSRRAKDWQPDQIGAGRRVASCLVPARRPRVFTVLVPLSQNHGVSRIEFREQIHMIKRNENLPADFNLSFGPAGDVWNPRTGELIGSIVHGP